MANKTTANWSQRVEGPRPVAVVYTRKNTSLDVWKKMAIEELVKCSAVNLTLSNLSALHAWETDDTPHNYAYTLFMREQRAENRRINPNL